jgi:type II secretory pathway pseudopilin PulG
MATRAPRDRGGPADRGETLVELVVTIAVMGLTVVAILGAIANSILLSGMHRKQAAAGAYVRAFAEAVESGVAAPTTGYTSCAAPSDYAKFYPATPGPGYASSVTVTYWNPGTSSFSGSCGTDSGVQRLALRVATTDNKLSETLVIVVRKPCRPTDAPCS